MGITDIGVWDFGTQKKKITKFVPKPRVWKLKDEDTIRLFTHEMAVRKDDVTKARDVQKKWLLMTWLKGSKQVCRITNGPHTRRLDCGIEIWNRWLPNERYVTKPDGNLNRLKINILVM